VLQGDPLLRREVLGGSREKVQPGQWVFAPLTANPPSKAVQGILVVPNRREEELRPWPIESLES
jgi:hypothetical protein